MTLEKEGKESAEDTKLLKVLKAGFKGVHKNHIILKGLAVTD